MSKYRREDADKKEPLPKLRNEYSPEKTSGEENKFYDKGMSRRFTIQEFVKKYKLNSDVDKG